MLRQEPSAKISKRAVLIGVVLIIANSYWIAYVEMLWHTAHLTTVTLSVNVMFALLVITGLNIIVRQIAPSAALSRQDLLVIYGMLAVGSAFSGHDCMPRLMGLIPYAFRFATPENDWEALLFRHLPPWLVVSDLRAVTDFFEGEVDFFRDGYFRYWITPILSWSVVIFSLMLIFLCLTSLIRRQWVEHEKLAYPVIQIPLEITCGQRGNFQEPSALDGVWDCRGDQFAQRAAIFLSRIALNSCQAIRSQYLLYAEAVECAGEYARLRLHPYMIGLGFILPLDLSFSCAFFLSIRKDATAIREYDGYHASAGVSLLWRAGHRRAFCASAYHMLGAVEGISRKLCLVFCVQTVRMKPGKHSLIARQSLYCFFAFWC